jgi:arylsulfate sulfotransferase
LAPHKGWENAGRDGSGFDTKPYLLTAIDDASLPFDSAVQLGDKELEQFSWSWGQHAPMYLPNGNLLVFDNGFNRNFGNSSSDYSTCVEYEIDESNKTVKQVWSYGKERGEDLFSFIVSDVDYLHETGNRLFMPGTVRIGSTAYAKIVEISESGEVVFEATLKLKDVFGNGEFAWGQFDLVYRSERFLLYNDY